VKVLTITKIIRILKQKNIIMILGVCGDSFFASISKDVNGIYNGSGSHFTEILAKKLGWDIVTFARGACSNQAIRLQIDEMINVKPDILIIGTTSPDRFEYPINSLKSNNYLRYNENIEKLYNPDIGIYNIDYKSFPNKSSENIGFSNYKPVLFSDTLNNIFNNPSLYKFLEEGDVITLEEWYNRFYDWRWKQQTDTWIISDGLRKLKENNIKFYCVSSFLLTDQLQYCKDSLIEKDSNLNPWTYTTDNVPYGFHTTLESQKTLAKLWYKKITNS
jgi:hypothetical protein